MSYTAEKELIRSKSLDLKEKLAGIAPASSQMKKLQELLEDIEQDYFTIMVVGEFKHGKSTFVNAILGKDIMPRDVTPTTATINAVFHSETPELHIIKTDGQPDKRVLSTDELNQFTALADFNINEIKYLKIFMDAPLLKNNAVLIDTPGVNDMNQQRSDVTFNFLPRADVIIFLTTMTAAFKKTEKTFIQEYLLKNEFQDKIIFAANFMDQVDEEEVDDAIDYVERRAQGIIGNRLVRVFPISSLDALEGKVNRDEMLLEYSGLPALEAEIERKLEQGAQSTEKLLRFSWRLTSIARAIQSEIETAESLSVQSLNSLQEQLKIVEEWFANKGARSDQINNYLHERCNEINYMIKKSIRHFENSVCEDIENRIKLFHGTDIKNLVESQIPVAIKSQFNSWINLYSDYIHELLRKTQNEVTKGLSNAFSQGVHLHAVKESDLRYENSIPILKAQTGNASVKAGVLLGGASTLAILLGGPFFLPLVGMAGLPFLSQKFAEKQLDNIRPQLMSSSKHQIGQLIDDFEDKVTHYVRKAIDQLKSNSIEEFERLLRSYEVMLKEGVARKDREAKSIITHQNELSLLESWIKSEILEEVNQDERI